jgi:hypothetical protein
VGQVADSKIWEWCKKLLSEEEGMPWKRCIADQITDVDIKTFNEERIKHYEIYRSYFGERPDHHLLCNGCRKPVIFGTHYDFSGAYPKRQVICRVCNTTDYVVT